MEGHSHHPGQARGWLLVVAIAALLGACAPAAPSSKAPGGAAGTSASGPGAPAAANDAASADRVVRGGTYVIGNHNDLINFDTATLGGGIKLSVMGLVQSGLMKWGKATVVDPSKLACDLCESWTQVDPTTYEFKLRQGVRWHNVPPVYGRELVADDVKYTLERVQSGNFRNDPRFGRMQPRVATIASIETPDRYTVRIHLKAPDAVFLWNMGDPFLLMVAREQVEAEKDGILQSGVIGTGPFVLKEFNPKISYTLERNPDYFIPGLPYLDRVEVRVIPDNTTRFNAFRAKEIHDPGQSMDAEAKRLVERQHPDLFLGEVPGLTVSALRFNVTQPPFDDPRVRRAINLAVDRQGVIDATRFGRAGLARWLPPAMGQVATSENEVAKLPGYRQPKEADVATARRLLAEAGYPNGFATELIANRSSNIPADGEVVIEQLRRNLNLDVKLLVLEQAVFDKEMVGRNFRVAIDYSLSAVGDADEILSQLVSTSGANFGAWKNARFDELYPRQRSALDPAERARLIGEMQTVLDDEAPVVTLYADYNYRGYPKGCHGVLEEHRYNVLLRYMSEVWCEEGILRK